MDFLFFYPFSAVRVCAVQVSSLCALWECRLAIRNEQTRVSEVCEGVLQALAYHLYTLCLQHLGD